ncbi:hypothetical protein AFM12_17265 [Jiulongibacter sediminis]|uniref:Uncharacterized protein n=2 Tax=Jiulongibacter sediminis TaxID=1605367 RepID=A0A0P7C4V0_9BACT|nr:hypothetical protein AFM12_17265 [Jiulongibacter sediminis]TBX22322.1 hypothetical protein TK44_17270 [Jiulongibacter sediminis]
MNLFACSKVEVAQNDPDNNNSDETANMIPDKYELFLSIGTPSETNLDSLVFEEFFFDLEANQRNAKLGSFFEEELPEIFHSYLVYTDDCEFVAAEFSFALKKTGGESNQIELFGFKVPNLPSDLEIIDTKTNQPIVQNEYYNFEIDPNDLSQSNYTISLKPKCEVELSKDSIEKIKEEQFKMELWKNNERELIDFSQKIKLEKSIPIARFSMVEFSNFKQGVRNTDDKEISFEFYESKSQIIVDRIHTYSKDLCSQPLAAFNFSLSNEYLTSRKTKIHSVDLSSVRIAIEPEKRGTIDIVHYPIEGEEGRTAFQVEVSFNCGSTDDVEKEYKINIYRTGTEQDGEIIERGERLFCSIPLLVKLDVQGAPGG